MINIRKLLASFKNAFIGIGHCFYTQQSFRIQIVVATIVIILGFIFNISNMEWLLLISSIFGVLVAELINTAMELTIDLIKKEKSKRVQLIKDISAAVVMMIALWSIVVGIYIFIPKL